MASVTARRVGAPTSPQAVQPLDTPAMPGPVSCPKCGTAEGVGFAGVDGVCERYRCRGCGSGTWRFCTGLTYAELTALNP